MVRDDRSTIEVGVTGEDRAVEHLVRSGYRIVERNYRSKLGELDIVARHGGVLVFVELLVFNRHHASHSV